MPAKITYATMSADNQEMNDAYDRAVSSVAESLGRTLPGRLNLVLTRSERVPFEGMQAVASIDEALRIAAEEAAAELCVIGGGEIYALCLPRAVRMHLTHVDTLVEGADAYFPEFVAAQWRIAAREPHAADAKHGFAFEFVDYERIGLT